MASLQPYVDTNGYRIYHTQALGAGNFSFIALGKDERSASPVAAKISRYLHETPIALDKVTKEPALLNLLVGAPHIVQMRKQFEFNTENVPQGRRWAIILDLIRSSNTSKEDPENLQDLLNKQGIKALSVAQVISCGKQLLECLVELKKRKIVHADLKPPNMIFNKDSGVLTLCDFGNSRKLEDLINDDGLTSMWYRPPEMFLHRKETDFGIDMWSLGVTLFQLYTGGSAPFPAPHDDTIAYILTNLGLPSDKYLKSCNCDPDRLPPLLQPKYMRDWKAMIRKAAVLRQQSDASANLLIDLLEKIFVYEKRISVEEALQHPLFSTDAHIKLDCQGISRSDQKTLSLRIQGLQIPLTTHCFHVVRTFDDQYNIQIEDAVSKKPIFERTAVIKPGSKLAILPADIRLGSQRLSLTEEKGDCSKPADKDHDRDKTRDFKNEAPSDELQKKQA